MDYTNINPTDYFSKMVFGATKSVAIISTPMWQRHLEGSEVAPIFRIVPEVDRSLRNLYIYLLPRSRSELDAETLAQVESDLRLPRVLGFSVQEVIGTSRRDCVLVDGKEAIVADYRDGGGEYVHVTNADVLSSIEDYFEHVWSIGRSEPKSEILYDRVLDILSSADLSSRLVITPTAWDEMLLHLSRNPKLLHSLSPRQFEELVAEMFVREGYSVTLTSVSRDGGKDILLSTSDSLGAHLYLVECKRYAPTRPVGVSVVRELYGTVSQSGATAGILVTTSRFTSTALDFRKPIKWRIDLKDYDNLSTWLGNLRNKSPRRP